jgi:hypothetical protein
MVSRAGDIEKSKELKTESIRVSKGILIDLINQGGCMKLSSMNNPRGTFGLGMLSKKEFKPGTRATQEVIDAIRNLITTRGALTVTELYKETGASRKAVRKACVRLGYVSFESVGNGPQYWGTKEQIAEKMGRRVLERKHRVSKVFETTEGLNEEALFVLNEMRQSEDEPKKIAEILEKKRVKNLNRTCGAVTKELLTRHLIYRAGQVWVEKMDLELNRTVLCKVDCYKAVKLTQSDD